MRRLLPGTLAVLLVAWGLAAPLAVGAAVLYRQAPTGPAAATAVNSNRLIGPEGSDQDVVTYDDFRLPVDAVVTGIEWRGAGGSMGFTIGIYAARSDPAGEPDISKAGTVVVLRITGDAGQQPVGKGYFDFHADLQGMGAGKAPFALKAGKRYWISIVSDRADLSPWGWASGTGGDGRSLQYGRYRHHGVPGDRAFTLTATPAER